ncbi:hypothetical protein IJ182_08975 [bacterium]|nr:hypothetical protein [bacterium]
MANNDSLNISNIELDLNEISSVKNLISGVLFDDSFNNLNYIKNCSFHKPVKSTLSVNNVNGNLEFISVDSNVFSPFAKVITEKVFFEIVGATNQGLSKNSGEYQEYLYGLYWEAKKENDEGFISDIFNKAYVFKNNLNYVKKISENPLFKKEWHKNFGRISPVKVFKHEGSLKKINIISEMIK